MDSQSKKSFWSAKTGALAMLLSPLLAVSPFLAGALLSLAFCGPDANEGNCSWAALPWLMFLTIPVGGLMFIIGLVILIVSLAKKIR
jgi:hypothetical protein